MRGAAFRWNTSDNRFWWFSYISSWVFASVTKHNPEKPQEEPQISKDNVPQMHPLLTEVLRQKQGRSLETCYTTPQSTRRVGTQEAVVKHRLCCTKYLHQETLLFLSPNQDRKSWKLQSLNFLLFISPEVHAQEMRYLLSKFHFKCEILKLAGTSSGFRPRHHNLPTSPRLLSCRFIKLSSSKALFISLSC